MSTFSRLHTFCLEQKLPWTNEAAARFAQYAELLLKFNRSMNLIGPMDRDALEAKLLIDSLTAAAACPCTGSILDVGTGAGFPGIPLKILYPDAPITLVEPRKKRCQFMRIAVNRLKLDNVIVHEKRVEDVELPVHDYVISKAFRSPATWLEIAAPLASPGGVVVAMHAPDGALVEVASSLGLRRTHHIDSVKQTYGAHEGEVVRSISVFEAT